MLVKVAAVEGASELGARQGIGSDSRCAAGIDRLACTSLKSRWVESGVGKGSKDGW